MSLLKTSKETGLIAWSQDPELSQTFAVGCFDPLAENGYLKIYNLDLGDPNNSFAVQNEIGFEEKFNCITWSKSGNTTGKYGFIAGGMNDGSLMLWDAATLMSDEDRQTDPLICNIGLYEPGEFYSLEFNNFKKEWLATGGSDVYIVNLENLDAEEPDVFCPETVENEHFITSVSWNKSKSLPHILATGSSDGGVNVWDLKVKRSICNFYDKSGAIQRNTQVSWNPDLPTQIAVTFDNAHEDGLQIWDLRNPKVPVTTFTDSHKNQAVHSLSWSTTNSNHILTGDRSGVVTVWDYKSGEIVLEEDLGGNFFTSQWTPNLPSLFYAINESGQTQLHTIDKDQVVKISQSHAPKWMKSRASGTVIGNSVLGYNKTTNTISKQETFGEQGTELSQVIDQWNQFQESNDVEGLCDSHIENSEGDETDLWKLLKICDQPSDSQLSALGFDKIDIVKKTESFTGKKHTQGDPDRRDSVGKTNRKFEFADMDESEAMDFFNQLSNNVDKKGAKDSTTEVGKTNSGNFFNDNVELQTEEISKNTNWDAGAEDLIRRNLFVGNFRGALDCALKNERYAHAFLIAYAKKDDPELMQLAADNFALLIQDPVSNLLQNVINDEIEELVEDYEIGRWRELAAFIIANYENRKSELLAKLGRQLLKNGRREAAQSLALLNQDFELFKEFIVEELQQDQTNFIEKQFYLIDSFKKLLVLKQKLYKSFNDEIIQRSLISVAMMLVEQTHYKIAYTLLTELGDSQGNEEIQFAMNQIYVLYQPLLQLMFEPPYSIEGTYGLPTQGRIILKQQTQEGVSSTQRENKNKGITNRGFGNKFRGNNGPRAPARPAPTTGGPSRGRPGPPSRGLNQTPKPNSGFRRNKPNTMASRSTAGNDDSMSQYSLQSDLDLATMNNNVPIGNRMPISPDVPMFKKNNRPNRAAGFGQKKPGPPVPRTLPNSGTLAPSPTQGRPVPSRPTPAGPPKRTGPPTMPAPKKTSRPGPPIMRGPPVASPPTNNEPQNIGLQTNTGPPPPRSRTSNPPSNPRTPGPPKPRGPPTNRPKPTPNGPPTRGPPTRTAPPSNHVPLKNPTSNEVKQSGPSSRGPPSRPGKSGPPSRVPTGPKSTTNSQKTRGPPTRAGPPTRGPPTRGAPPTRTGPSSRGGPPTRNPPVSRSGTQQTHTPPPIRNEPKSETNQQSKIDYDILYDSLAQAQEFLADIVDPGRLKLYQNYLTDLENMVSQNRLTPEMLEQVSEFFECLCDQNNEGARQCYVAMKKIANSNCREWLSVLDIILKNL